ncbi:MAG TPA: DUF6069 family protein [Pseudonocardiaceae bacterium]|nr:DUF6069 family protein [Pseudonocardiaceae bacterium]
MTSQYPERDAPKINPGRLWAGGFATAVVAALVAVVGILIARGLVHVAVLAPKGDGVWGNASTVTYALLAGLFALAANGLLHFLLLTTPRATQFFGWIMVLLTIVGVVVPLTVLTNTNEMFATAALNLLIGLITTMLLISMAGAARVRDDSGYQQQSSYPQTREW